MDSHSLMYASGAHHQHRLLLRCALRFTCPHRRHILPSVRWRLPTLLLVLVGAAPFASAVAQCSDSSAIRSSVTTIGSTRDDQRRMAEDLGRCPTRGALVRSSASLTEGANCASGVRWALVAPTVDATSNSALPFSLNDGPLWAGRGLSSVVTTGFHVESGPLSVSIAPQFTYEQNRAF